MSPSRASEAPDTATVIGWFAAACDGGPQPTADHVAPLVEAIGWCFEPDPQPGLRRALDALDEPFRKHAKPLLKALDAASAELADVRFSGGLAEHVRALQRGLGALLPRFERHAGQPAQVIRYETLVEWAGLTSVALQAAGWASSETEPTEKRVVQIVAAMASYMDGKAVEPDSLAHRLRERWS